MWQKIDKAQGPAYRQMMDQIMRKIEQGELNQGERLASERKLAEAFGVNRSTVVHALEELRALGILTSKQGSGRYVNQTEWGKFSIPRIDWRQLIAHRYEQSINHYEEKINRGKKQTSEFLDLYSSEMPNELLPDFQFPSYSLADILMEEKRMNRYGYLPLKEKITGYLKEELQLTFAADQLLVTGGGQQAIFLILQTILSSGDAIAVESPSFFYRLPLFKAAGIRLFGVAMDEEGIDLKQLETSILKNQVKAVLVNPNFQNPTGKVMSQKRREALVQLCRRYQLPIIEDDVFTDFSFSEMNEVQPLRLLDPDNVLYIGSLSRVLGRTTKIGWVLGPETLIARLANAQEMMEFSLSIVSQMLATSVFDEAFLSKMSLVRQQLVKRSQRLIDWSKEQTFFELHPIKGGYYAWLTWEGKQLSTEIADELIAQGLGIAPAQLFGEEVNGLRLNFSRLSEEELPKFSELMNQAAEMLKK